jgi:hypothetical protein
MSDTTDSFRHQRPPDDFQKFADDLASSNEPQNLKFEREDWSLFRTIDGLQQRAGVPKALLPRLVLKEVADNALDEPSTTTLAFGEVYKGRYFVKDNGQGIAGTPQDIARLFSINRPMVSTKLLRKPTRGALGNGLRVVAGAVLASEGSLVVTTRNQRITLRPERDGTTTVVSAEQTNEPTTGTRVDIAFGPALPWDDHVLDWAITARKLANHGSRYQGESSTHWYDAAQFRELLYASGQRPVRDLIAHLDGCSGGKAGEITAAAGLARALCNEVTSDQTKQLLMAARSAARTVNPKRLGAVGSEAYPSAAYGLSSGTVSLGSTEPLAEIPYVAEAWAWELPKGKDIRTRLSVCINRTPATGQISAARDKRLIDAFGCGLSHTIGRSPEGRAIHHRAQSHNPVYADHFRRQSPEPRTVPRWHLQRSRSSSPQGPPAEFHRQIAEGCSPR